MTAPGRASPDLSATVQNSAVTQSETGTATWLAERAVLGALLRRPERTADFGTWLGAQDFADPQHLAMFATIVGLRAAGELRPIPVEFTALTDLDRVTQQAITQNVLAVRDALEQQRFSDLGGGSYHELITELFVAGGGAAAEQYTRYGQKVLEMSVRRQAEAWGVRMEQAARPELTMDGNLAELYGTREAMMENLSDLSVQVRQSRGEIASRLDGNPVSAPVVASTAMLPRRLVERAERLVIHAVIADPGWRESGLLERLRPEDFVASPAHQNTWRAIQAIMARGEPIDPVMVAWEIEVLANDPRRGLRPAERMALPASELAAMSDLPAGDVGRAVSTVARSALGQHARQAQQEIEEAAADRRSEVSEALATVRAIGEDIEKQAERLVGVEKKHEPSTVSRGLAGERTSAMITPAPSTPARTR